MKNNAKWLLVCVCWMLIGISAVWAGEHLVVCQISCDYGTMDIEGYYLHAGARLMVYPWWGGSNQKFVLAADTTTGQIVGATKISPKHVGIAAVWTNAANHVSPQSLDLPSKNVGEKVIQWFGMDFTGKLNQLFQFIPVGPNTILGDGASFYIKSHNGQGLYLGVKTEGNTRFVALTEQPFIWKVKKTE